MLGDVESEYMSLRCLAQYFEQTGDTWLADHFHQRCLETSVLIKSDGRKKEGEAHCNVGLSLENRGRSYHPPVSQTIISAMYRRLGESY